MTFNELFTKTNKNCKGSHLKQMSKVIYRYIHVFLLFLNSYRNELNTQKKFIPI